MNNDTEKEIIYEFDAVTPKSAYTKVLYGKISRKFRIPLIILEVLSYIEMIILYILSKSFMPISFWAAIAVFLLVCNLVNISFVFYRKKNYKKIHEANEDCFTYTFYNDSVKMKNPSIEAVLKYTDAENYAEDKERLAIIFPFNRSIWFEKSKYSEEQLNFFRSIVSDKKQKKFEKKTIIRFIRKNCVNAVIIIALTVAIFKTVELNAHIKANTYHSKYVNTTFESFEECMNYGSVKDVVIIKGKYIEYTYSGKEKETRYSTKCPDGKLDELKEKMDKLDVEWRNKEE